MPRKPNFLNMRQHLEHLDLALQGLRKYGYVPAIVDELVKAELINRSILRRHNAKRAAGSRHDIYINH